MYRKNRELTSAVDLWVTQPVFVVVVYGFWFSFFDFDIYILASVLFC